MNKKLVGKTLIVLGVISLILSAVRISGYIAWPWYWVFSPMLGYISFMLPILVSEVLMNSRVSCFFALYDFWVGVFVDTRKRIVYICPIPCCCIKIELGRIQV